MAPWIKARTTLIIATALALSGLALYVKTAAPTVLTADGGEFQFVPYLAGIAHPTGYPLYTMLGWLWSHALPCGDVAYRMNLFSVLWAAVAVTLLYLSSILFLRLASPNIPPGALHASALVATATLAVSQTFWSQAVIAEVYSLNAFFVVLIFYLLLRWRSVVGQACPEPRPEQSRRDSRRIGNLSKAGKARRRAAALLLVAFTYGLSLTHHRTMLLLAPAMVVFLWLAGRETHPTSVVATLVARMPGRLKSSLRNRDILKALLVSLKSSLRNRDLLKALLVLLLPLLLYLYIPWRAPFTPYLRLPLSADKELVLYHNTPQGFWNLVMGQMFRGELGYRTETLPRLRMVADLLRDQFGLLGVALGLLGVLRLALGRRWALLALTGLAYLANAVFTLVYFIGDIFVLFIPSYLVFALWLALGAATLGEGVGEGIVRWKGPWEAGYHKMISGIRSLVALAAVVPLCILPLTLLARNYPQIDQSHNYEVRDRWQQILAEPLPRQAILVSNDRDEIMPLWYYQLVEGRRPDLQGLFPRIVPDPAYENIVRLVDEVLATDRPIYLIKEMPGLEIKYQLEPFGSLVQVVGPAVTRAPDHAQRVSLSQEVSLIGYDQEPPSPRPGQELRVTLYWQTQGELEGVYSTFVHLVDEEGQRVAGSDQQPGGAFYPTNLWRPAEVLRDEHALTVPPETPPGRYRLLVGMYSYPSLDPLGERVFIGRLEIGD